MKVYRTPAERLHDQPPPPWGLKEWVTLAALLAWGVVWVALVRDGVGAFAAFMIGAVAAFLFEVIIRTVIRWKLTDWVGLVLVTVAWFVAFEVLQLAGYSPLASLFFGWVATFLIGAIGAIVLAVLRRPRRVDEGKLNS